MVVSKSKIHEKKTLQESNTKKGALIAGIGLILGTVSTILTGDNTFIEQLPTLLTEIGGILTFFGIRDLPLLNNIR